MMTPTAQQMRVAQVFLVTAVTLGLCGMFLGVTMGAMEDFRLKSVHAHLNLIGFVTLFLAGVFYRVVPAAAGVRAWAHYGITVAGLGLMLPGVAGIMLDIPAIAWMTKPGSLLVVAGMILFLWIVATSLRPAADGGHEARRADLAGVTAADDRQGNAAAHARISAEQIIAEAARAAAARARTA